MTVAFAQLASPVTLFDTLRGVEVFMFASHCEFVR